MAVERSNCDTHPEGRMSTKDLVRQAVEAWRGDFEAYSQAVHELSRRGGREALEAGLRLCQGRRAYERQVGAYILQDFEDDSLYEERLAVLLDLLNDKRPTVLRAAAWSLGMMGDDRAIEPLIRLRKHPSPCVRIGVAMAISQGFEDEIVARTLVEMSRDPIAAVREWATMSLGYLNFPDLPEIRDALVARLEDARPNVRGYAITSLAAWRDERVLPALQRELARRRNGVMPVARALPSDSLKSDLIRLKDEWTSTGQNPMPGWESVLERAISASTVG